MKDNHYEFKCTFGHATTADLFTAGLLSDAFLEAIGEQPEDGKANTLCITNNWTGAQIHITYYGVYIIDEDTYDSFYEVCDAVTYRLQVMDSE